MAGTFALVALHALRSELDPSWHMISEYAVGQYGWLMAFCFATFGIACGGLSVALAGTVKSTGGKIGIGLLVIAAIGLVMAAMFPMDPITVPPEKGSFSGMMHGVSAMLGIPGLIAASLVLSYALGKTETWEPVRLPMQGFAHLSWLSLVVMIGALVTAMQQNPAMEGPGLVGWANRLLMLAYAGWLMVAAWPLVRVNSSGRAS